MSKTEIITLLLSSAVISGVVTTALTYFFDTRKNKDERIFQIKREAYIKAISAISGISETIFDYIIKKHSIEKRLNPLTVIEFIAAHTRDISPAILVSNDHIRKLLKQIPSLIIECATLVEVLTESAEKTDKGFVLNPNSPEANRLRNWKEKIEKLEDEVIVAMQQELHLTD